MEALEGLCLPEFLIPAIVVLRNFLKRRLVIQKPVAASS